MKVGCHVSIAGSIDRSIDRAAEIGCDTFQIFTRNPRMWKAKELTDKEVENFYRKTQNTGMWPIFSHMPYLPNLSSSNEEIYNKSVETLKLELKRCNTLKIPFVVTHLGSHLGEGIEKGKEQVVKALESAMSSVSECPTILLENTSGKLNDVGSTFKEIGDLIDNLSANKVGVCFDTCHAYVRGYDISTSKGLAETIEDIETNLSFEKISLIHLNDTVGELGSRLDRHQHIGLGNIGEKGFINFLDSKFRDIPLILETPIDEERTDKENLLKVRELVLSHMNK